MRIVVVGAGIAGLVSAAAAHRAGHQVTVLERGPADSTAGAGISLFGNALRALDTVPSLGDRVRAIGGAPAPGTPIGIRTPSGRWLVRSVVAGDGRLTPASEVVVVHRSDLQRVLLSELPADLVRFDSNCRQVDQHGGMVTVTWRGPDGISCAEADLVVAADGIRSPLRNSWWPDHDGVRFSGYTSWRGITSGPVSLRSGGETWGRGRRFGYAPLRDGRVYWFATESVAAGVTVRDDHAAVLERFGRWHDPIPMLIAQTRREAVLHHDINDLRRPLDSFVNGRVVLVGDSAHAMTPDLGQGGCQAIEDAVTLVRLLDRDPDVARALARYDELRRRRTQSLALRARRLGRVGQARSRAAVALRDALLRLVPSGIALNASESIQRWAPPAG